MQFSPVLQEPSRILYRFSPVLRTDRLAKTVKSVYHSPIMKKTVFITGASGVMGSAVLRRIAETQNYNLIILLREKERNKKQAKRLSKKYGGDIKIVFGDLSIPADCERCVQTADYIIHCAAIIPPRSDYNSEDTYKSNYCATFNLVTAAQKRQDTRPVKFIHIGTVAEYGNRTFKHPWIRTGDPLLPSAFDYYAATKVMGEREVIESGLSYWVSLRQSGVLYQDVMLKNMHDGLMFHTCWNTPIEWATAETSGLLLKNLLEKEEAGTLPYGFWRRVYNIGNGAAARVTGYETLDRGMRLMGRSAKEIFKPHWHAARNFHCGWFYDSHILNDYFDFQHEGFEAFFKQCGKKFWYFKLGKPFPRLISKFAIRPLLKTQNAPLFWVTHNLQGRIKAFFGSKEQFDSIPKEWSGYHLLCEDKNPETGAALNYADLKDEKKAAAFLLDHGYDETKPQEDLDIEDMKGAAAFRGGSCVSGAMMRGDLYTPLEWECALGHKFRATPYLVLKTGHWCPQCSVPPWNFDALARNNAFYAQVWYDDHQKDENAFYEKDCFKDISVFGKNPRLKD